MATRATARQQLLAALDPLGFRDGRIDLPLLWPAVKAWLLEPATDVQADGDERSFYLSRAPGDGTDAFAGAPPPAIAGQDLVCIDVGRTFNVRDGIRSFQQGDIGLVLWYPDGPVWDPLAAEDGWIEAGPGTPHIDAFTRGDDPASLTSYIEHSLAFTIASRQHPLAAEIADSAFHDNLLVLAAA
jgi:hypothetical protein